MKLATSKVTRMMVCKRCGGAGYRSSWHPDMGRCWGGCNGTGQVVAEREGSDVVAYGFVARPYDLEHGLAKVQEILLVESLTPSTNAFMLNVFTRKLDGSWHHWSTRNPKLQGDVIHRIMSQRKPMRDMPEARVELLVGELFGERKQAG